MTGGHALAGDADHLGLPPRPSGDPAVVAAITAAAAQLLSPRVVAAEPTEDQHFAWRFSGRWWARPLPVRRDRPWTMR